MNFATWRGSVGIIKPTLRLGGIEELFQLLPRGVAVLPLYLNVREGTVSEFKTIIEHYEDRVKDLAEVGVDLIHPEGAPPFMVAGRAGERDIVDRWEQTYSTPVVTAPMTQFEAMRALGITKIVGASYFRGEINELFGRYFEDAGIGVLEMAGMDVDFNRAQFLSSREVYGFVRELYLRNRDADGVYLLGSGWQVLDIVKMLEDDLEVPVVHAMTARIWAFQHRLHIRERIPGYGRLLDELPRPAAR